MQQFNFGKENRKFSALAVCATRINGQFPVVDHLLNSIEIETLLNLCSKFDTFICGTPCVLYCTDACSALTIFKLAAPATIK